MLLLLTAGSGISDKGADGGATEAVGLDMTTGGLLFGGTAAGVFVSPALALLFSFPPVSPGGGGGIATSDMFDWHERRFFENKELEKQC
jgi:hypothetical protein